MGLPCYSARFVEPFAQVLSKYERFDAGSLNALKAIDPASRIPIEVANQMAIQQVAAVDDVDLGLKAARVTPLGRGGALEYAMNSAATLRDALEVSARFATIFCDVLRIGIEVDRTQVIVRLESGMPAPRTIHDYAMALWYVSHTRAGLDEGAKLKCWFAHSKPPNTIEYERSFGQAGLRFGAPCYGFAFAREYLDAPLPASDPGLHIVLCDHMSRALRQACDRPSMTDRVRQLAMSELLRGDPTVGGAAGALRMSTRTLASRLEGEGTTFRALLDELKRELALRYLTDSRLPPAEVSFRLGFSHVESFYRAFKRWTGETPVMYRRAHGVGKVRAASPG